MAQSISVQDFNKLPLDADSIVLDTRNTLDYTKNHLSHSLSIPAAILPRQLKNLDPKKLYYILSYTGRRSEALADQLTAMDFRAVYIIGGMELFSRVLLEYCLLDSKEAVTKNRVTASFIPCLFLVIYSSTLSI